MRSRTLFCLSVALFAACDDSATPDGDIESSNTSLEWRPLGPHQSFAKKSLEEWAIEYKRWSYSQTSCEDSPAFDTDGSDCALYQDPESPVFFLEAAPTEKPRTKCKIPKGKAIAVPIMMYSNDNAGITEPLSESALEQDVAAVVDSMRDLKLRANDVDIPTVESWIVGPVKFSYVVPQEPNWYSCNNYKGVSDTVVEPSFLGGYFAIFPAPPVGGHELEYAAVATLGDTDVSLDVTTRFVVEATHD